MGNGGETSADRQDVDASLPCLDCLSTHQVFVAPGAPTVPATLTGGWYNTKLTVRINATTTHPDGLSGIGYQFLSGPESSGQRWGGGIHIEPVSGNAAFFDFGVQSQGVSKLSYWAIGADGTVECSRPLTLSLDLSTPDVVFNIPAANGSGWNNTAVSASYTVNDGPSGPAAPTTGNLSFPSEGRLQFQSVTARDIAGNVSVDVESHLSRRAGRYLNIDTTAPILTPPANLHITIPATGAGYGVAPASFVATAVDPALKDLRPGANLAGSGVVVINNPGATQFPIGGPTTFTFSATDAAGNTSSAIASVTVVKASTAITAPNQTVQYGMPMVVTAALGASFATGPVTFTFGPSGAYSVVGIVSGGVAVASVPPVLLGAGTYPMLVSYGGDSSVLAATTTATVTVFTIGNLPPVCGRAYGGEIWPPNHKKFHAAPVRGVFDPDGGVVNILVTGISQDEQIDSTGDGKFSPDGNGVGTSTAWVRAERNGHGNKAAGNGRVYEISFTATDNGGGQCKGSVLYGVPHDQGQRPEAIDSGMRYDSTGVVPGARDKSQIHQNSPRP